MAHGTWRRVASFAARWTACVVLAAGIEQLLTRTGHRSAVYAFGAALTLLAIMAVAEATGRAPGGKREAAS